MEHQLCTRLNGRTQDYFVCALSGPSFVTRQESARRQASLHSGSKTLISESGADSLIV